MYEYISSKYVNVRFIITSALTLAPYLKLQVYTVQHWHLLPLSSEHFSLLCLSAVYCLPLLHLICTPLTTALFLSYLPLLPTSSVHLLPLLYPSPTSLCFLNTSSVHHLPLLYPSPTSLCSLPHVYTTNHCSIPLLTPSAPYLMCTPLITALSLSYLVSQGKCHKMI